MIALLFYNATVDNYVDNFVDNLYSKTAVIKHYCINRYIAYILVNVMYLISVVDNFVDKYSPRQF